MSTHDMEMRVNDALRHDAADFTEILGSAMTLVEAAETLNTDAYIDKDAEADGRSDAGQVMGNGGIRWGKTMVATAADPCAAERSQVMNDVLRQEMASSVEDVFQEQQSRRLSPDKRYKL